MNTKNISTLIGAFLALAVLATACGGGDASANDQPVIDAVAQAMRAEGDVPAEADIECMATALVVNMGGAETLESEYGLTPETIADGKNIDDVELPREQATVMADGMMECGLIDVMVGEMSGDDFSEEDARCLVNNMDQDALRDTFASEFMNDADSAAVGSAADQAMELSMFAAITECGIDLGF